MRNENPDKAVIVKPSAKQRRILKQHAREHGLSIEEAAVLAVTRGLEILKAKHLN